MDNAAPRPTNWERKNIQTQYYEKGWSNILEGQESPNSDKHLISPYNITTSSNIQVIRIKKIITKDIEDITRLCKDIYLFSSSKTCCFLTWEKNHIFKHPCNFLWLIRQESFCTNNSVKEWDYNIDTLTSEDMENMPLKSQTQFRMNLQSALFSTKTLLSI